MFGKTKWYKTAYKAYRKKKMSEEYSTLFRYYINACWGCKLFHADGHYDFISIDEMDGETKATTEDLRKLLPEHLFKNYLEAVELYNSMGDEFDEEKDSLIMDKDEYLFWHTEESEKILIDYVNELKEQKII